MSCLAHSFHDVPVVPGIKPIQVATKGGPIWPDFAQEKTLRHCRDGRPVDLPPVWPEGAVEKTIPAALWGCFIDLRFGHLVAEHLSRLPLAVRQWPDLPVLFAAPEGVTVQTLPRWIWEIFDWIGLDSARVQLVTQPMRVGQLFAVPQQEMMFKTGPSQPYLDLLTSWTSRLNGVSRDVLYVTRAGLVAKGHGGFAGEGYVSDLLNRLGIAVLDPAASSIPEQLNAYAGAQRIVFCEGSAVHGRQLLGHIDQEIHILRRRDGQNLAQAQIAPRVGALRYHDVGKETLPVYWKSGLRRDSADLRLYDLAHLFRCFAALGVDLPRYWSRSAYRAAALADIEAWLALHKPMARLRAQYHQILRAADMLPAFWQNAKAGDTPISDHPINDRLGRPDLSEKEQSTG